jgi:putative ABC transport system permease protein
MFETKNLIKIYKSKKGSLVRALDGIDLRFEEKGVVFILGKSGSGKSTLLNVLGGLDSYDEGEIIIKGKSSKNFKAQDFDSYRNTYVGFIFQDYNILEEFSVAKNLGLALQLQRKVADEEAIESLLQKVDLGGLGSRNPNELSGGQKQRVAIARALIKNPDIIMADEPTGNLDSKTGQQVFETLQKLGEEKLVLIVSHDRESAEKYATRIIELSDGKVISDIKKTDQGIEGHHKGIKIINNEIVHIKRGYQLTQDDVEMINKMILHSKNDIVISSDPSVSVEIDNHTKTKAKGKFIQTSEAVNRYINYGPDDFKVIKSKLPYVDSLKMGANGLKTKKFRLVMTILLSVIAFTFFTLSDTLASFDFAKNSVQTMYDNQFEIAAVYRRRIEYDQNNNYMYDMPTNFTSVDHEHFANKFPQITLYSFYQKQVYLNETFHTQPTGYSYYYMSTTTGFIELDDASDLSLGIIELTDSYYPTLVTEVAITDFLADHYIKYGLKNYGMLTTYQQIIGKNMLIGGQSFKITAILNTNSNLEFYKEKLDVIELKQDDYRFISKFEDLKRYLLGQVFVKKGFAEQYFITAGEIDLERFYEPFTVSIGTENRYTMVSELKKFNTSLPIYTGSMPAVTTIAQNQVVVSTNFVRMANPMQFDTDFNNAIDQYENDFGSEPTGNALKAIYHDVIKTLFDGLITENNSNIQFIANTMIEGLEYFNNRAISIKGVVLEDTMPDISKWESTMYIEELLYDQASDQINSPSGAYFLITNNRIADIELFRHFEKKDLGGFRYIGQTPFSSELNSVRFIVEVVRPIFFWISVVFASFSTLLMANFISMSITHKKKEIGILRAIGARSSDVFGIFFNESLIIATIDYIVTMIISITIVVIANISLKAELETSITIFAFGIRQIFLLALICGGVAFIASLIPVRKIAKMKPIDAIKNA